MRRAVPMFAIASALTAACAPLAAPRFPDDVASAIADHDMRRFETDALIVYYPDGQQELARRIAGRAQGCALAVRARAEAVATDRARPDKPVLVIPDLPLNNAFVIPRLAGAETIGVVATHSTLDFTTTFGLPPDPGFVACHELVHAIHEQQITGGWAMINRLFGSTASPQLGLDAWFWEGVAVHYESALQPGAGRLAWPIWRGTFAAGYAGGDDLDGDDLNEYKRLAAAGHHYVVGSHFVAWLVERYGENRLWSLVNAQAGAIVFPLSVSGRFGDAYGNDLPGLVEEWRRHVARTIPRRAPPASQQTIRAVGNDARYARSPGGVEAVVWSDNDVATRLTVTGADGDVRFDRELVIPVPGLGPVVTMASPLLVSGLSFTADGKWLYMTAIDQGRTYQKTKLLRLEVGRWRIEHVADDLGPGGAVSPDGLTYWVAEVDGDAWGLAAIDLKSRAHERRVVIAPRPGQYVVRVAPSRSGDRLALSVWDGTRFAIWIVDATTGERLSTIAGGAGNAPVYDATWIDDLRILYLKDIDNRFQVAVNEWSGGAEQVVTDVPYTAFEPRAAGGHVRFLDRQGWQWILSEVPVPADTGPAAVTGTATDPASVAASVSVVSDTPYSLTDGLFRPQLHGFGLAAPSTGATLLGLVLGGGDRLGQQRWAIAGYVQPNPDPIRYSWAAQYHNAMLAPWSLSLTASDFRWHHGVDEDPDATGFERYEPRRQLDVTASVWRTWYGAITTSVDGIVTRDQFTGEPERELAGGGASLSFAYGAGTPRGGTRWLFAGDLSVAYFPARASSLGQVIDYRSGFAFVAPMIGTRTATLHLGGVLRGLDNERDLLEVGAGGPFSSLYDTTHQADPVGDPSPIDDALLPDHARFSEPVRGFEDMTFPASEARITEIALRVPILIDAGWISSLWVLPPTLVRELQLEVFRSSVNIQAGTDAAGDHSAAGASATLALALWRAPVLVRWQVAKRLSDDRAITQFVGLGVGF